MFFMGVVLTKKEIEELPVFMGLPLHGVKRWIKITGGKPLSDDSGELKYWLCEFNSKPGGNNYITWSPVVAILRLKHFKNIG